MRPRDVCGLIREPCFRRPSRSNIWHAAGRASRRHALAKHFRLLKHEPRGRLLRVRRTRQETWIVVAMPPDTGAENILTVFKAVGLLET